METRGTCYIIDYSYQPHGGPPRTATIYAVDEEAYRFARPGARTLVFYDPEHPDRVLCGHL